MILLIKGVLRHGKNLVKKQTEIYFSIFIENQNWDLKFVFRFENKKKNNNNKTNKKKKSKFYFLLKRKSNVPFDPRIVCPCS